MGNFSREFTENTRECNNKDARTWEKDEIIVSSRSNVGKCDISANKTEFLRKYNNKQLNALPPKPPQTKKMGIANGNNVASDTNNKHNCEVAGKQKTRNFFRRTRSSSMDVFKDNKNSLKLKNNDVHRRSQYENNILSSSDLQSQELTSSFKKSFINGWLSPRIARHLPFTSNRSSIKEGKTRTSIRSRTRGYETSNFKLPTHRENSTVSVSTRDSCDTSRLLDASRLDNLTSCSSIPSLSSIDSQQSEFHSNNHGSHKKYFNCVRERNLNDVVNKNYVNLQRDPTIFGPRRTSNERNNDQNFNSNLFLNTNQGKGQLKIIL